MLKYLKLFLLVLFFTVFFRQCYLHFTADYYAESAQRLTDNQELSKAMDAIDKAIDRNPQEPNYYRLRGRIYVNLLTNLNKEIRSQVKKIIISDLEMAYKLNPRNLVTVRNIIPLYYFIGAQNVRLAALEFNIDEEFLPTVKEYYSSVQDISANDVGVYVLLAKYQKRLGLTEDYNYSVSKVKELRPDLLEWYLVSE